MSDLEAGLLLLPASNTTDTQERPMPQQSQPGANRRTQSRDKLLTHSPAEMTLPGLSEPVSDEARQALGLLGIDPNSPKARQLLQKRAGTVLPSSLAGFGIHVAGLDVAALDVTAAGRAEGDATPATRPGCEP
jgi:hypothetical protein